MPSRIPKACRESNCPLTTLERHGYCLSHEQKAKKAQWQGSGKGRGGRPWRRMRDQVKAAAKGLCSECSKSGIVAVGNCCDHIIPEAEEGLTTLSNLQWLCQYHHDIKTKEESKRGLNRRSRRGGAG